MWNSAPRAVAATAATRLDWTEAQQSIVPLLAGVAAAEALGVGLKWPNDLMSGTAKLGGLLVESSNGLTLTGIGLNLWWPDAPAGWSALFDDDPGDEVGPQLIRRWATRFFELVDMGPDAWPIDRYRIRCLTIGRQISWDPDGRGRAVDIAPDGALVVETIDGLLHLRSGAVRHVR